MGDDHRLLAGVKDAGGGVLAGDLAAVAGAGDLVDIGAGGVHLGVHVGDLALHQLERPDRLAELLALREVGHHLVQAGGHDAGADARQDDALVVEARHQDADALALGPEHVFERHLHILEDQFGGVGAAHPELVEVLRRGKALHGLFDDEGGDALRSGLRVGLGIDDEGVGIRAVGDPELGAVQNVVAVALFRAQLHRHDVGPRPRLRHGERADMGAGDQARQVRALLRVRPVQLDLVHAKVRMCAIGQADRGRGAGDLLRRDDMGEVGHARPAVFLRHGDAQKAKIAHFLPKLCREAVGAVDLGGDRLHPVLCPAMHHVAQRLDLFSKVEFHGCGEHRRPPGNERLFNS